MHNPVKVFYDEAKKPYIVDKYASCSCYTKGIQHKQGCHIFDSELMMSLRSAVSDATTEVESCLDALMDAKPSELHGCKRSLAEAIEKLCESRAAMALEDQRNPMGVHSDEYWHPY